MDVKRFRGIDMRDALKRVKKELGDDAVILHTKTASTTGILGVGKRTYVEILASKDVGFLDSQKKTPTLARKEPVQTKVYEEQRASIPSYDVDKALARNNSDLLTLKEDMLWMKSTLGELAKRSKYTHAQGVPDELMDLYIYLMEQEVAEDLAIELIHRLKKEVPYDVLQQPKALSGHLTDTISNMLGVCQPIELKENSCLKVAFVGPTGVGKTTTIAKLAADFALVKKKKVSVITIDTYRIAAVEQIKTYMDIIDVPLEVVSSPKEMQEAVERQRNSDIILIDTAGRSQNNHQQIVELKSFIKSAEPDEVHLVLSTTSHYKNTMDIIEKFGTISIDKILFTKLDEAVNFGLILNVFSKVKAAMSYVTTGQSVPDDIEPANQKKLADLVLGGLTL